jgi:hypothetical protein
MRYLTEYVSTETELVRCQGYEMEIVLIRKNGTVTCLWYIRLRKNNNKEKLTLFGSSGS